MHQIRGTSHIQKERQREMLNNNSTNPTYNHPSLNLWAVLDWIFPPFCCNCQKIGFEICPECWQSIDCLSWESTCQICGKPVSHGKICPECHDQPPAFNQLKSWAIYHGAAKNMVTGIKYQRRFGLIPFLTPTLVNVIRDWKIQIDFITPVPLGRKRMRERGYNQADLIAKPVAKKLQLPYYPQALYRVRETRSQVGLDAAERRENLQGAFSADTALCRGKTILVMDDISTTGATLDACAAALKQVGAKEVFCFTVARTDLFSNSNSINMEVRK
jgi:competence protein ComFC